MAAHRPAYLYSSPVQPARESDSLQSVALLLTSFLYLHFSDAAVGCNDGGRRQLNSGTGMGQATLSSGSSNDNVDGTPLTDLAGYKVY